MARRKRLTETEQQRIVELREAGWPSRTIATEIGCSPSSVNYHCTRLGIALKPKALGPRGPRLVFRNGKPVRRYSPDEDARILQARLDGTRFVDIARELGRPVNSIIGRLYTLGRQEGANEAANEARHG